MTSSDERVKGTLRGLGRAGQALAATIDADRLSPSYLFEGSDGEIVRQAALLFAAEVLAMGQEPRVADRTRRRVRAGTHPDLHVQERDKATVISVAALSELLSRAFAAPAAGARQVFLLDPAEAMEPEGIARYLKALEEPPDATVFVLVSTRADRLPETVLSRVRRIRIPPLSESEIAERLREDGVEDRRAARVARWSAGSLARARRMAAATVPEAIDAMVAEAVRPTPATADVAEQALSALRRDAQETAAEDADDERADVKRERLRVLLADVVHGLGVEARDAAAERAAQPWSDLTPRAALRLLEDLGRLAVAVPLNVTPAVLAVETVRALRQAWGADPGPSSGTRSVQQERRDSGR